MEVGHFSRLQGAVFWCTEIRSFICANAGMGQYRVLRGGLDVLVANDQLELLLSRRSGARSGGGGLHMASSHASSNFMQSPLKCFHVASLTHTLRPSSQAVNEGAVRACQGVANMSVQPRLQQDYKRYWEALTQQLSGSAGQDTCSRRGCCA